MRSPTQQVPYGSLMNRQVFDFDDARNDEESIGGYDSHPSGLHGDKMKRPPRTKSTPTRDGLKGTIETIKNIDIKIELEANSSGSEDAFTDRTQSNSEKKNPSDEKNQFTSKQSMI